MGLNGFGLDWACVGLGGFDHVYKGFGMGLGSGFGGAEVALNPL